MFQTYQAVSPQSDKDTRFTPASSWSFADELPFIAIASGEAQALAAEYVIVFSSEQLVHPVALLGLEGKNTYVTPQGGWAAERIPARLRVYPFASVASDGTLFVLRASKAPHFQAGEGEVLFDGEQPSPFLNKVLAMLGETQRGMDEAAALAAQIDAAGLLIDGQLNVAMQAGGAVRTFGGFKVVSEERVKALDKATRAQLEKSGAMTLIAAHRASLSQIGRLVKADPATPAAMPAKAKPAAKPAAKKTASAKAAPAASKAAPAAAKAKPAAKAAPAAAKKTSAKKGA